MNDATKLKIIRRTLDEWEAQYKQDDEDGASLNPFYMIQDLREVLDEESEVKTTKPEYAKTLPSIFHIEECTCWRHFMRACPVHHG